MRNYMLEQGLVEDTPLEVRKRKPHRNGQPFEREWQLQAACVKVIRAAMKHDENLEFLATITEGQRGPVRASIAKAMGLKSGPSDIFLFRRTKEPGVLGYWKWKFAWVELKLPGKWLTEEQDRWQQFFMVGRLSPFECHRCDSLEQFKAILAAF